MPEAPSKAEVWTRGGAKGGEAIAPISRLFFARSALLHDDDPADASGWADDYQAAARALVVAATSLANEVGPLAAGIPRALHGSLRSVRWGGVALALLCGLGCSEPPLALEDFACGHGGECPDAGLIDTFRRRVDATPADANVADAAPADAIAADGASLDAYELRRDAASPDAGFDTTPPTSWFTAGPSGLISTSTVTFSFECSEPGCNFTCALDIAAASPCTSPVSFAGLRDGAHRLEILATDASGNCQVAPTSRLFTVDTAAPDTTIDVGPTAIRAATPAVFEFGCDDVSCTFECALDGAAWMSCSSPLVLRNGNEGAHQLLAAAIDAAGNRDPTPAAWSFIVDETPPDTFIRRAPAATTADRRSVFELECDEPGCTFECSVDAPGFVPCAALFDTGPLELGAHTFAARAIDRVGLPDPTPATHQWTVRGEWLAATAGAAFTCGITSTDRALMCWGNGSVNQNGIGELFAVAQPRLVASGPFAQVSAHASHACAVDDAGVLTCWGSNLRGQLGGGGRAESGEALPIAQTDWRAVGVGREHTCALRRDDSLWCWGVSPWGALGLGTTTTTLTPGWVGTRTDWATLGVGGFHTCVIDDAGALWCFGHGGEAALGTGRLDDELTPIRVGSSTDWVTVVGGGGHTCGLQTGGRLYCWGDNENGAVGDGGRPVDRAEPVLLPGSWTAVTAGRLHTCGIRSDGTLWCWGLGDYGALGTGDTMLRTTPTQVSLRTHSGAGAPGDWASVTGGYNHTCAITTAGELYCTGANFLGELGTYEAVLQLEPARVPGPQRWDDVTAGYSHTCAVEAGGDGWCWGTNTLGQLGDGTATPTAARRRLDGQWRSVLASFRHTCGVRQDGTLWCWGWQGSSGALGHPSWGTQLAPRQVGTDADWELLEITRGPWHYARKAGALWGWGANGRGYLGLGTETAPLYPQPVGDPSWLSVDGNVRHTCALAADGTLPCWGENAYGQLGVGSGGWQTSPVTSTVTGWANVGTGGFHTCAVRTNDELWCWGRGNYGQVGRSARSSFSGPPWKVAGSGWRTAYAGRWHSCGIKHDGSLWCWGQNASGQLGDGTTELRTTPTRIGAGTDWSTLSLGDAHTCGIKADQSVWCWGHDGWAQLGFERTPWRLTFDEEVRLPTR